MTGEGERGLLVPFRATDFRRRRRNRDDGRTSPPRVTLVVRDPGRRIRLA